MYLNYYSNFQVLLLLSSLAFFVSSQYLFNKEKIKWSLFSIFLGSLFIGAFVSVLDPFLHLWDEQFHALVAKNLLKNPLRPALYTKQLLPFDYRIWVNNEVWLHKQPLFLWQIALSLKLFGFNEFAVRVPSILLHAFIPLLIYRVGKIIHSKETGFYGALFFAIAYFPLELVSGKISTDHNDSTFMFYVFASFWAWYEYQNSNKKKWLILIGIFSGGAVLIKWLMGLLIFVIWGICILFSIKERKFLLQQIKAIVLSFIISIFIFIPWQLFIYFRYPIESIYELKYNSKHFFIALEGHKGDVFFHIDSLKEIYGSGVLVPFVYLLGVIILITKSKSKLFSISIISSIMFIYIFYTVAATKMIAFCAIACPFTFLGFGSIFSVLMDKLNFYVHNFLTRQVLSMSLFLIIGFHIFNLPKITKNHKIVNNKDNSGISNELINMELINKIKNSLGNEKYVVFFNGNRIFSSTPFMFYTHHIAYNSIPSKPQLEMLSGFGYKIAVYDDGRLPDYIKENSTIKIVH